MDINTILQILRYASTVLIILAALYGVWLWARGIAPALKRLGLGLANRKIAIFAKGDRYTMLENALANSELIDRRNVFGISDAGDLGMCEDAGIFLVDWLSWSDRIEDILHKKQSKIALVVFAPPRAIPDALMTRLDEMSHATVTNFRGRVLNDIILAMIATAGAKK